MQKNPSHRTLAFEKFDARLAMTVFGFDSRIEIPASVLKNPVNSLGSLAAYPAVGMVVNDRNGDGRLSNGEDWGTAFLISSNLALTAAHVVYGRDDLGRITVNSSPRKMIVRFGWDGAIAHTGVAGVQQWMIPDEWRSMAGTAVPTDGGFTSRNESLPYDYALLVLDQNMGVRAQSYFVPMIDDLLTYRAGDRDQYNNNEYVLGYPSERKWQIRGFPQVITGGPILHVGSDSISTAPRDFAHYNPNYTLLEQRPGESDAQYNQRVSPWMNTTGIDTYGGMSGGPLFNFEGSIGIGKYNFNGIVSRGDASGNYFTPVSQAMKDNLNRWTGTSGNGTHFALSPVPGETSVAIVTEYYSVMGKSEDPIVQDEPYLVGNGIVRDTPGSPESLGFGMRLFNRGLKDSQPTKIQFYLSDDDTLDTSTDTPFDVWNGSAIAAQSDLIIEGSVILPDGLQHGRNYYIGWQVDSEGDDLAKGIFSGSLKLNSPPRIAIDPSWLANPQPLFAGIRSPKIPLLVADDEEGADNLRVEVASLWNENGDFVGYYRPEYLQVTGSGRTRYLVINAPASTHELALNPYVYDSLETSGLDPTFIFVEPTPTPYFAWNNFYKAADVSGDSLITAIDALLVINAINQGKTGRLPPGPTFSDELVDVNADGNLSAIDALLVINLLNRAEGESQGGTAQLIDHDDFFAYINEDDVHSLSKVSRRRAK